MPNDDLKLSDLGEFGLIEKLLKAFSTKLPSGYIGAGDDCAVIPLAAFSGQSATKGNILISTDSVVENQDFRLKYTPPYSLGRKLLAMNLSDIAAMGGLPKFFIVTVQAPKDLSVVFLEEVYRGLSELSQEAGVVCLGGDTSAAQEVSLSLTVVGYSEKLPIMRSNAKAGDQIWVSGTLGTAKAGFELLENAGLVNYKELYEDPAVKKFLMPQARLSLGQFLLENNIASAAIDLSDGLVQDLAHIIKASGVAARLFINNIPANEKDKAKLNALSGGEDYELLFTARAEFKDQIFAFAKSQNLSISQIGEIISSDKSPQITLVDIDAKEHLIENYLRTETKVGFQHYR